MIEMPPKPCWWRRRTTIERAVTIISVFPITFLGIILLAINASDRSITGISPQFSFAATLHNPPKVVAKDHDHNDFKLYQNICLTEECINTASSTLSAMDKNVEPCDNFYQFACGNYAKLTNKNKMDRFLEAKARLQLQLKQLFNEEEEGDTENIPDKLAKSLYKACMNNSLIEERGLKPIQQIAESLGGWPAVVGNNWNESSWSWTETIIKFKELGFDTNYIISFFIEADLKNSSRRIIILDQSKLELSREFFAGSFDGDIMKAYYNYIVDLATTFGAEKLQAQKEILDSIKFEAALANISFPNEQRRNATALYNLYSIKELQGNYSYLNWLDYINAMLSKELTVDENEILILTSPTFFQQLGTLLERTPKRTIANYLMTKIYMYAASYLNEEVRKRKHKYEKIVKGRQQEARWVECLDSTISKLPVSVGALYIRKYFKEEAKNIALEMMEGIKAAFENILKESTWLDTQTKGIALHKLHKMAYLVGYPDEMLNNSLLDSYYRNLEVDPKIYLKSILNIDKFARNEMIHNLRKPVNKTDWRSFAFPAIIDAFYFHVENSIKLPAGIFQGKFFSINRPRYMNYGSLGQAIGHEITHGFDDIGRQFDSDGNLVNWWQDETKRRFSEKTKCIIEQYGNYTEKQTGEKLNGVTTQGENIADNGGTKESYNAYNKWEAENGVEQKLPGLNYTSQQMFWISMAQTWCSVQPIEAIRFAVKSDEHSLNEFRVLGPLKNSDSFSKDFNCPLGSPMNPVHKCEVW